MRTHLIAICAATVTLGAVATAQAFTPPPGFTALIAPAAGHGQTHRTECSLNRGALSCRWVGRLPRTASCSFGGAVPTWVLRRRGPARATHVCMDEGYHGWPRLRAGRTWRAAGFTCRHRTVGAGPRTRGRLLCRAPSGHGFALGADNRPVRIAP